ncbi:MAG: alcohol dehydrogenase catalytic domain-containing protein [Spirochaetales bacterium]|nr:alcohol dehydrogenase catalytic domain-containing protein [Spirochaetales bacterium]
MKAVLLSDIKKIEIRDVPPVHIEEDTDVLIKVGVVGICGSDIHYYKQGKIGDQIITFPQIIGHEMAGTVEQVGKKVSKLKPGDTVAVDPSISCFACDQCKAGRLHTCRNLKFVGCPGQLEGCLTEYIVLPEENCFILPDHMSLETGALCEPLTVGYYAVQRTGNMEGKSIGILGAGPIGLSVILSCMMKNARIVYVTDILDYRCHLALQHGAHWAGNPDRNDIVDTIIKSEPYQLDVVFECCGKQEALDQAFLLVKPGGIVTIAGIPEFDYYRFPANVVRRKEICIQQVRRQNDCTSHVVRAVGNGLIKPDFMITHHFSLKDTGRAFEIVSGYKENVVKAMIHL